MDSEQILEHLKKLIEVTKNNNKANDLDVGIEITIEMAEQIVEKIEDLEASLFEAEEWLDDYKWR